MKRDSVVLTLFAVLSLWAGCASDISTRERAEVAMEEPKPLCNSHLERWLLTSSDYAGSVLAVELRGEAEDLSDNVAIQQGHIELQRDGELLLRFDVDRLLTDHAMGKRYRTFRDSLSGQEVTVVQQIEAEAASELRIAAADLSVIADVAPPIK